MSIVLFKQAIAVNTAYDSLKAVEEAIITLRGNYPEMIHGDLCISVFREGDIYEVAITRAPAPDAASPGSDQ